MGRFQIFHETENAPDVTLFFKIVSGEQDQVRLQSGHLFGDLFKVAVKVAQVQITDLDDAHFTSLRRRLQHVPFYFQGLWLIPEGICQQSTAGSGEPEGEELAPAHSFSLAGRKAHKNLPEVVGLWLPE
jgi:hypothetical protein